jgi:hypothetical protein
MPERHIFFSVSYGVGFTYWVGFTSDLSRFTTSIPSFTTSIPSKSMASP